ncbi:MAG: Rnf-Nqr domain containing protein [Eubacteriales bacterium]
MENKPKSKPIATSQVFLKGILFQNPALVLVVGICPIVAAAVSLRAGALLAGVFSLVLIITQFIASVFLKKVPRWLRVAMYLLIGLAVVCPIIYVLEQYNIGVRLTVGIYLPLMAANSLAALHCETVAVRRNIKHSFLDSIATSIGYSLVLLLVGFVRELLGSGKIADRTIPYFENNAASGMLMPFGGFIVLGFAAAMLQWYVIRRYPEHEKNFTFGLLNTSASDRQKPVLPILSTIKESYPAEKEVFPFIVDTLGTQPVSEAIPLEEDYTEIPYAIQASEEHISSKEVFKMDYLGDSGELIISPEEEILLEEEFPDEFIVAEPIFEELPFEEEMAVEVVIAEPLLDEDSFEEQIPVEVFVTEHLSNEVGYEETKQAPLIANVSPTDNVMLTMDANEEEDTFQLESNPSSLSFAKELDSKAIDTRIQGLLDLLNEFENKTY